MKPTTNTSFGSFAFMGTPRFAVYVLEELELRGHVPSVVFCAPDKPTGRKRILTAPLSKEWAKARGIPTEQPANKKELELAIARHTFVISIVAAYNIIISPHALKKPTYGTLNIHPSLLPKWRGPTPIQAALLAGDTHTGVCIMVLDEKIDHGPILGCEKLTLIGTENYLELEETLARKGGALLDTLVPKWIDGTISLAPQDHIRATYSKKYTVKDAHVNLIDDNPQEIERKVRAFNPEPGAWAMVKTKNGIKRIKILSGTCTKEGAYTPFHIIPESKSAMLWSDFIRGNQ